MREMPEMMILPYDRRERKIQYEREREEAEKLERDRIQKGKSLPKMRVSVW